MEIIEVDNQEYGKLVLFPFTGFECKEFYALNAHKVDDVKYLIFNDGKNRFAFVGGLKNGVLKFPFSASFECFSEITKNNKILHYYNAVEALVKWSKEQNINKIVISLPPVYYNPSHITKMVNALYCNKFKVVNIDVNYEYFLENFTDSYEMSIDIKSRQKLRASLKNNLSFEKTTDFSKVYEVIKANRIFKGFPLWMTLQDIIETSRVIPTDLFLVSNKDEVYVASALVHHICDGIVRVVYWGNIPESDDLKPMNFLSYHIFKYYYERNMKVIDIGISTEDSVPNYGLCDFKEGIGCSCSEKKIFELEL